MRECPHCGEELEGDGYNIVIHCPNADMDLIDEAEADAPPIYCEEDTINE